MAGRRQAMAKADVTPQKAALIGERPMASRSTMAPRGNNKCSLSLIFSGATSLTGSIPIAQARKWIAAKRAA